MDHHAQGFCVHRQVDAVPVGEVVVIPNKAVHRQGDESAFQYRLGGDAAGAAARVKGDRVDHQAEGLTVHEFGAWPGAQAQGAFPGFRAREVRIDPPDLRPVVVSRRGEVNAGRHGGGYRSAENAALHQPLPFPGFINGGGAGREPLYAL